MTHVEMPSNRLAIPVLSMTCALMSVFATMYCGDYLIFQLSRLIDLYKSVSVRMGYQAKFLNAYGLYFWFLLAVATGLSLTLAVRRPRDPRIAAFAVGVLFAALVLAFWIRQAAWSGFETLFGGVSA